MYMRSYPPKEYHTGLYVTYYNDHKGFYMMTSFTMVFTEPDSEEIDFNTFRTIGKLLWHLLQGRDNFNAKLFSTYFKNLPDSHTKLRCQQHRY